MKQEYIQEITALLETCEDISLLDLILKVLGRYRGGKNIMTEELTPIPGYEGLYSITPKGKVYSHTFNTFLRPPPKRSTYGHTMVCLYKNGHGTNYSTELLAKIVYERIKKR